MQIIFSLKQNITSDVVRILYNTQFVGKRLVDDLEHIYLFQLCLDVKNKNDFYSMGLYLKVRYA